MRPKLFLSVLIAAMLALPAWAQTTSKPLNLKLPPSDVPAASASTARPPSNAPGVYYGDTSGRTAADDAAATAATTCDDATYNQPQVHGSVGMGVVSGNHVGGSYQTGTVDISKAFGSCDHPTGGVSFSVGGGTGSFHGRRH
jgi:hypothetical protein